MTEMARVLREADDTAFFAEDVVATLDEKTNVVRVRRSWWRDAHPWVKREVWKMTEPYLILSDFDNLASHLPPAAMTSAA